MKTSLYFNYTTRSLVRGGQRTLLAIFCVAVGVMAIVALQLVGLMINNAFDSNVRDANGGDIAVRSQNQPFTQADLAFFAQLKKEAVISDYTPVVNAQGSTAGAQFSLSAFFSVRAVDPATYPVVTPPTFTSPANGSVAALLKNNQVIVTQAFIDQYKKKPGDALDIRVGSRGQGGRLIHAHIAGIVSASGVFAQAGSVVLVSVNDYKNATFQTPSPGAQPTATSPAVASDGGTTQTDVGSAVLYDTVDVTTSAAHINLAVSQIQSHFRIATTQTAADALKQQQLLIGNIRKFLAIAGLLALLIGGVGIVNTMQVLLSRRKMEIAMLKTTGYRRLDLYLLFGLEAGILGLVGGIVGATAATAVSYLVRNLVQQSFGLTIPFLLDWYTIGGGVVIGLLTALIFGLLPIVQAANIRPLNVIRELPQGRGAGSILSMVGLLILLSALFCLLAIVILSNDVLLGVISVYGAAAFLLLLSLFFGLCIFILGKLPVPERFSLRYLLLVLAVALCSIGLYLLLPAFGILLMLIALMGIIVVVLPRSWKATVKMALRNLDRQRARTTTTLLALFVGIFTIGLIVVLGQNLHDQVNNVIANTINYNVFIITSNDDTAKLQKKLFTLPGLQSSQRHILAAAAPLAVNNRPIEALLPRGNAGKASDTSLGRGGTLSLLNGVEGYDVGNNQIPLDSLQIVRGRNLRASDAGTNNVVLSSSLADLDPLHLKVGDTVRLASIDRTGVQTLTIVGFYHMLGFGSDIYPVLGTGDTARRLSPTGVSQTVFYMKIDPDRLNAALDALGRTVPAAFVLNVANIGQFINQLLNDVLLTLTTIASLSLLAGLVIIANAVALAMLERRRELGILKSLGYTSRIILSEVLLENGLVGGTGALLAMLLVTLATLLLGSYVFAASFVVDIYITLGLIFGSALLAMLIAALVAWGAVRVRPLEVLRYE